MAGDSAIPAPARTPETSAFWDAANEGRLLYGACITCGKAHYYPRRFCPWCFSPDVEWKQAAGTAVVHTFSVVHRANPPYVTAYVTLTEGVTLMTNLVDCDPGRIAVGYPVHLVFRPAADGQRIPFFGPRPAGGADGPGPGAEPHSDNPG